MFQKIICIISFGFTLFSQSQNLSSQIIDSETHLPVPFATVQTGPYNGVMSNEEGKFTIATSETKTTDSLTISCLGYKTLQLPLSKKVEAKIFFTPDIYHVIPVFLETRNLSGKEIMDKVKENLETNYNSGYTKSQLFNRNTFTSQFKTFDITLKESTLDNINQKLLDHTFKKFPRKFVSLNETFSEVILNGKSKGKYVPIKTLKIQNKEELASAEKIQQDFMQIMNENFKSDSNLIIKTGIIRLDKTESIDSILKEMEQDTNRERDSIQNQNNSTKTFGLDFQNFLLNKDSDVDVIFKSNRYEFIKKGFAIYENEWLYILEFSPKGNAKYKGKLYIDSGTFAIVKAEIYGAKSIFDKHFNMLGITANELTFKNIAIFKKINTSYVLSYYLKEKSNEAGINRPFTVIEKNDHTKGKKRINRVEVQMNMHAISQYKNEYVLSQQINSNESELKNLKPNPNYNSTTLSKYDQNFWDGYNILTPEKAIQELKIEE